MRPNILWFDESYSEELHRVNTIKQICEGDVDLLIVVGKTNHLAYLSTSNILETFSRS
jgi:NAD-dependent SIR2 family protein deacetylase